MNKREQMRLDAEKIRLILESQDWRVTSIKIEDNKVKIEAEKEYTE